MIQPEVRRVASSSSTMKMTPSIDVEPVRRGGAVGEVLAAPDRVEQDRDRGGGGDHVEPADAVAEARRQREQQEAQHHHERDVGVAQRLGRDDVVGGSRGGTASSRSRSRSRRCRRGRSAGWRRLPPARRIPRPCAAPRPRLRPGSSAAHRESAIVPPAADLPSSAIGPLASALTSPGATLAYAVAREYSTKGATAAQRYAWLAGALPSAAWAAASRAIGTRNGEQDT